MQKQKSIFQKPFLKFLTLLLAFYALTLSVVLSQSNAQNKNKKEPVKIFHSSKSMAPKQEEKKKDIIPIVPSSKAPDPGQY